MWSREGESEELKSLQDGGEQALAHLFSQHRDKLQRMVHFRLDKRLYGRVDTADVLQEGYMKAADQIDCYLGEPDVPVYVWLRQMTREALIDIHRRHLGTKMRDASLEIGIHHGGSLHATSYSLAAHLVGNLTSPSGAAMREELLAQVRQALEAMEGIDREILALRHFEELNNNEVAEILGIKKSASSNRYMRALKRLKRVLSKSSQEDRTHD